MSSIRDMKKNISLNYIFNGLFYFNFTSGLWVLYMLSRGMTLAQVGLAEAVYHITGLTMEVPTGMVADLFGRKVSRIVGAALRLVSTMLMIFAHSFPGFCLSFAVLALANTFESGAGDALVYDSLKSINEEESYQKVAGRTVVIINTVEAIAMFLGWTLANSNFIRAYLAAAVIECMILGASTLFTEPEIEWIHEKKETFIGQLKSSINVIRRSRRVSYIIALWGGLDMASSLMFFYGGKVFENKGMNLSGIGLINALYLGVGAVIALFTHRLDEKLGEKKVIPVLCLLTLAGIYGFSYGTTNLAILSFLAAGLAAGIRYPLFSDYINKEIPSQYRATILSLNSAVFSLFMIIFFPLTGFFADRLGIESAFRVVFIPVGVVLVLLLHLSRFKGGKDKAEVD